MIYIHTTKSSESYINVGWCTENEAGVVTVDMSDYQNDSKALAEIFVINKLIQRFPSEVASILTSQGAVKKALAGSDKCNRPSASEADYLLIKYPKIAINTSRKTAEKVKAVSEAMDTVEFTEMVFSSLSRPEIESSIGTIQVTKHAMNNYLKSIAPAGTLNRLQKLLTRKLELIYNPKVRPFEKAIAHAVYRVVGTDVKIVVTEQADKTLRLRTCYKSI